MDQLAGFDFVALNFGDDGTPTSAAAQTTLLQHVGSAGTTDVVLMAHGFRNDEHEALRLYRDFFANVQAHRSRPELKDHLASRTFAIGGILWPSKAFAEGGASDGGRVQGVGDADEELDATRAQLAQMRDTLVSPDRRGVVTKALALLDHLEDDTDKQNEFVALMLSLVEEGESDPTEGFAELKAQSGAELLAKLGTPIILPTSREGDDGGVMSVGGGGGVSDEGQPLFIGGFFKSAAGRVGQFLNMTTWYLMKNRAGTVGAVGVAAVVRALKAAHPSVRVHLVGHSLGGRCMAACLKALADAPPVRPDSVSLLEAAFSHYGFSANNGKGSVGFFRDVVAKRVVRGPFISTYSYQDTVVGVAYALSSRLAGDNVKAIGDKDDQYGGIGRNGTQRTDEARTQPLHKVGEPYVFALDVVNNLDGSGGGIKNHGDVTNDRVTYAFAWAVAGS